MEAGYIEHDGARFHFVVEQDVAKRAVPGTDGYWHLPLGAAEADGAVAFEKSDFLLTDHPPRLREGRSVKMPPSDDVAIVVDGDGGSAFLFTPGAPVAKTYDDPRELETYLAVLATLYQIDVPG